MENKSSTENTSSSILLTGVVFLANLDFVGLLDYALKAGIGGAIWLGYKLTADYIDRKRKSRP
jgi:hypothetical protein